MQPKTARSGETKRRSRQVFTNGEIHNWYTLVLGYSDRLVSFLIDKLRLGAADRVLDPFCGAGTTLVECMKRGIECVGVDANPSSCFAARVKTDWRLSPKTLLSHLDELEDASRRNLRRTASIRADRTYRYIEGSGMVDRGWISPLPLRRAIAIKTAICGLRTTPRYQDALTLALVAEVVSGASNVKFGPELYCGPARPDREVFAGFAVRVRTMAEDLRIVRGLRTAALVCQGDSRELAAATREAGPQPFTAVISSPPYPAEHDYTRNARLELAFLEHVHDVESLRTIKRGMIRCHTKGIYVGDSDGSRVNGSTAIAAVAEQIRVKTISKTHKFAPLYPDVVRHYFGGMKRHLISLWPRLSGGAACAYVVGDQAGYLRVHIPTADLLAEVASNVGYEVQEILQWREGSSHATRKPLHENILILRKPVAIG